MAIVRTLLKLVIGLVAVAAMLLVVVVMLLQSSTVSNRVKDLVVPAVSQAVGREVRLEQAKLGIFPRARVNLVKLSVAGRQGEPPLAQFDSLAVGVKLWPLIVSLGKDVQVQSIHLVKPVVNLVRAPDGTWNYEGLGSPAKTPEPGAARPTPPPPPSPAPKSDEGQVIVVIEEIGIEDGTVQYTDRLSGTAAAVAVSKIDFETRDVGIGRPFDARLSAALAATEKNFSSQIRVSRLPGGLEEVGPGRYPELSGELKLDGLDLGRLRGFLPVKVTQMMTGGRVDAQAKLSTADQRYAVNGAGKLTAVRLRGQPASGSFEVQATVNPVALAVHAIIDKLVLKGPGIDLGGRIEGDLKPVRVRFALSGQLLDLEQIMGLVPVSTKPPAKTTEPLLTAQQRKQVEALDVQGTLAIGKIMKGALVASDFKAKARLERGVFVLYEASTGFFDGRVTADGTTVDLGAADPTWKLKAKLTGVDMGKALEAFSGSAPVVGRLDGTIDFGGEGVDWQKIRKVLVGPGLLNVNDGAIMTADIGKGVVGGIAQALQAAGKGAAAEKVAGAGGKTTFKNLALPFKVKDGAVEIDQPITYTAGYGATRMTGKIGLEGSLMLQGSADLSKETLQTAFAGTRIPAPARLQVPITIGGTLEQPVVRVDASKAVGGLLGGVARQAAEDVKKKASDRAKSEVQRGLGEKLKGFGFGK